VVLIPDYDTGIQMLHTGQADLLIANRYLSVTMGDDPDLEASPVIFNPTRLHFVAPLTGRQSLLDAIDRHLAKWKEDPKSIYYSTLKHWTGDAPKTVIPRYIKYAAILTLGIVLLISGIALLFRRQVRVRTAELCQKTRDLETALQSLKETQDKAIQQERLHTLGEMASGIAHDFNNILTPVIGLADLLLLHPDLLSNRELVKKNLTMIADAGRDGAEIVQRMKEFYRIHEPGDPHPADPCNAVRNTIELCRPRWEQVGDDGHMHVKIETRLERGLSILVQESELREALINLLFNSIDAMPSGGTITFSVKKADPDIVIRVSDTGTGMPEEVQKKCLAAFYTTKGITGTGMGLAMVKAMCDRYDARIQIDSKEGCGTTVSLFFPQYLGSTAPDPVPSSVAQQTIRSLNILAVDDEPRALYALETILHTSGHHVTTVTDPGEALKLACSNPYDLIITDRSMPGLSGEELARSIQTLPSAPPIILLTGTPSATEIIKQKNMHILLKPLDLHHLNRLLNSLGF
jgi:signal transduction histidine kinase